MTMLDYIRQQPSVLLDIWRERARITAPFVKMLEQRRPTRIMLTGSGTSGNAGAAAASYMQEVLGIETVAFAPSRLPGAAYDGGDGLYIALSQGGGSTNTIAAMRAVSGRRVLGLTSNADSSVARLGVHLDLACGEETVGARTKGYTATVATLMLCASEAAGISSPVEEAARAMPDNIERCIRWLEDNRHRLAAASSFNIIGKGVAADTAREGALKILETLKLPAASYEFEEYLHGPCMAVSPVAATIAFMPCDGDATRAAGMMEWADGYSKLNFMVSGSPRKDERGLELVLSGSPYTSPFEHILPCQIIAALMPSNHSIELFEELSRKIVMKERHERREP